jgi:pimeloyl-ACP methyl ester carboxylesterase
VGALVACALTVALLSGCSETVVPTRSIALAACRLPKLAQEAQCGHIDVPEHRGDPASRRIAIFVAVLPANTLSPKPDPLFVLAGGPGQSATEAFGPESLGVLFPAYRNRDLVIFDQRGSGRSGLLRCPPLERANLL